MVVLTGGGGGGGGVVGLLTCEPGGGGGGGAVFGLMTTVEAVDFIEVIEDCDMVEDKVELGELEEFLTLPLVKL